MYGLVYRWLGPVLPVLHIQEDLGQGNRQPGKLTQQKTSLRWPHWAAGEPSVQSKSARWQQEIRLAFTGFFYSSQFAAYFLLTSKGFLRSFFAKSARLASGNDDARFTASWISASSALTSASSPLRRRNADSTVSSLSYRASQRGLSGTVKRRRKRSTDGRTPGEAKLCEKKTFVSLSFNFLVPIKARVLQEKTNPRE